MYTASRVSLSRLQRPVQRFLCAAHKSPCAASGIDLCRFRNLFLLILLLVGTGLDMGAVNENCVRIDHTVIEHLVENMLENLTVRLFSSLP